MSTLSSDTDESDRLILPTDEEAGGVGAFERGGFAGLNEVGEVVEHRSSFLKGAV